MKESPYIFSKFNPLNMDTPLIKTLWRYGPSVSVLTAFDCTFNGVRKKITRNIRSCLIGKSGFRFWNPDFRFCNRTRIRKLVGKTTVLKDSFSNPFSDSQSNGKIETSKTDISALKSVFGFRVRLQIRYPVLKSKSRFPNRTHPKKKRCLLPYAHVRDIRWKWNNLRT